MSFLPMPTSWAARNLEGGGFWRTDQCEMGTIPLCQPEQLFSASSVLLRVNQRAVRL